MKLRPRFFDGTAFKKDITRFAPLWVLYLIGGLMMALSTMGQNSQWWSVADKVNDLSEMIGAFGLINLVYGMLCAQLLQGDLFNSKLCNALHAMPMRREGWFVTHMVSGLLFSLVPNTVIALSIIPFLKGAWFTAFLWLLGMEMHFLFFFGLASFSIHCTGSRFASIVVYVILNFLSVLVGWFADTMYLPMLYGVEINTDVFLQFCPVAWLLNEPDYFRAFDVTSSNGYGSVIDDTAVRWGGMGESWGYLSILTVLGVVFLVLALLLYRARHLESAGDFVAFKAMRPVFWVLFSLCAGGFIQLIGVDMIGLGSVGGYIFLALGLICGYFVAQMLIARTTKVFKKRNFLHLGIFLAVFILSLVLNSLDFLGIARYVPNTDRVERAYISDRHLTDAALARLDNGDFLPYVSYFLAETQEDIDIVRDAHGQLYTEGPDHKLLEYIYITYVMKDGSVVRRTYQPSTSSEAYHTFSLLTSNPSQFFHVDNLETLQTLLSTVQLNDKFVSIQSMDSLAEALWEDMKTNGATNNKEYHAQWHEEHTSTGYELMIRQTDGYDYSVIVYPCHKNTLAWIEKHGDETSYLSKNWQSTAHETQSVTFRGITFEDIVIFYDVFERLYQDLAAGTATQDAPDKSPETFEELTIRFWSNDGKTETLYLSPQSLAYAFLLETLKP